MSHPRQLTIDRLTKIAEHLERGQLGHEEFYFGHWNADEQYNQLEENGCGYCGCAIGEAPFVFPDEWHFKDGVPVLREAPHDCFAAWSGMRFFDLPRAAFEHLFLPLEQEPMVYGGKILFADATREEVAANIREFIAHLQANPEAAQ
jgi:hypothetical protein